MPTSGTGQGQAPGRAPAKGRRRIFFLSLAFSAGFTAAFTALGVIFSGGALFVGQAGNPAIVAAISGLVVVLLGLNVLFDFIGALNRDTRLLGRFTNPAGRRPSGPAGAFLLGLAFAAGWSPCIGPILASILLFAGREGNILRSVSLLVAYSLGFALPFLAAGVFFDRVKPVMDFFKRRGRQVRIVSGLFLVAIGIVMAFGKLGSLSAMTSKAGYALADFASSRPLAARISGLAVLLLLEACLFLPRLFRPKGGRGRIWPVRLALGIAVGLAAVAELAGLFSLAALAGQWLTYTGI